jgi:hypothetical protein
MTQPGDDLPIGWVIFASIACLLVLTFLLIIPTALVLIPLSAAAGALGAIVVGSLAVGDAEREVPADDGTAPDPARRIEGVDPAWPHYLAGQAINDAFAAGKAVQSAVSSIWRGIGSLRDRFANLVDLAPRIILGPLMVLPYLAGAAASLGAGAGTLVGGVVTGSAAGVLWVIRRVSVQLVRQVDRVQVWRAGAGATCTAQGCFGFTQQPTVECDCGRLHIGLRPGHYGVIRRQCTCGEIIPSTVARAASSLLLRCPWCRRKLLPGAMLDTDVRVAVIGASDAGKTSFTDAAIGAVRTGVVSAGGSVDVLGSGQSEEYEDDPQCTSARIALGRQNGTLHLFDAPGRVLDDQLQRVRLYYLRDVQGFALVIDPAAVPWLAGRLHEPLHGDSITVDPVLAYRAVVAQLLDSRTELRRRSLAVVLNKADLLETSFDGPGPAPDSDGIRSWLAARGQNNLVQAADRDFGSVRYFLATSVGDRSASAGAALYWLAGRSGLPLPRAASDTG